MKQYLNLLNKILTEGTPSDDRTGTGTLSLFSETLKFDTAVGFPLVTTKFVNYKAILNELLWFIKGYTNTEYLDSKIWDAWADDNGEIGPMYGYQWRNWNGKDQLQEVITSIKNNPNSRRHVVSAWNVASLPDESISPQANVYAGRMALAPCHHFFQFYVRNGKLDLHFSMRSTDVFLGLPFNIASYATLLYMVAQLTDNIPGILSYHGVDVHLYKNHIEQAKTQILRKEFTLPTLSIKKKYNIDDFTLDDFTLNNYIHNNKLVGKISV